MPEGSGPTIPNFNGSDGTEEIRLVNYITPDRSVRVVWRTNVAGVGPVIFGYNVGCVCRSSNVASS